MVVKRARVYVLLCIVAFCKSGKNHVHINDLAPFVFFLFSVALTRVHTTRMHMHAQTRTQCQRRWGGERKVLVLKSFLGLGNINAFCVCLCPPLSLSLSLSVIRQSLHAERPVAAGEICSQVASVSRVMCTHRFSYVNESCHARTSHVTHGVIHDVTHGRVMSHMNESYHT